VRHGDIKPANVVLATGETVKLIDFLVFGMGGMFGPAGDTPTRACGTPGYMAPEQMLRGEITIATDIYSLGATLLQILTLALPQDLGNTEDEPALRRKLEQMNPDAVVCAPVLHRCLAHDPARRFASVAELLAQLPAAQRP
jgi:serine/threonine protein kinase